MFDIECDQQLNEIALRDRATSRSDRIPAPLGFGASANR
jgi:hypothetical protein